MRGGSCCSTPGAQGAQGAHERNSLREATPNLQVWKLFLLMMKKPQVHRYHTIIMISYGDNYINYILIIIISKDDLLVPSRKEARPCTPTDFYTVT